MSSKSSRKGRSTGRNPNKPAAVMNHVWDKGAKADLERAFEMLLDADAPFPEEVGDNVDK